MDDGADTRPCDRDLVVDSAADSVQLSLSFELWQLQRNINFLNKGTDGHMVTWHTYNPTFPPTLTHPCTLSLYSRTTNPSLPHKKTIRLKIILSKNVKVAQNSFLFNLCTWTLQRIRDVDMDRIRDCLACTSKWTQWIHLSHGKKMTLVLNFIAFYSNIFGKLIVEGVLTMSLGYELGGLTSVRPKWVCVILNLAQVHLAIHVFEKMNNNPCLDTSFLILNLNKEAYKGKKKYMWICMSPELLEKVLKLKLQEARGKTRIDASRCQSGSQRWSFEVDFCKRL